MDEQALKERLQALHGQPDQPFSDPQPFELTPAMLEYIGTTDAELRDELIYSAFVHWIELRPAFTPDQLRHILNTCLDDHHMGWKLGERDEDSVFTRSFSVLVVPLILKAHRATPFLTGEEIQRVKQRLIAYAGAERDIRGLVSGKGWAHAAAHTADAMNELSLCPEMGADDLEALLIAIRAKISTPDGTYSHREEERYGETVDSIVSRGLITDAGWRSWLDGTAFLFAAFMRTGRPACKAPSTTL